MTALAAADVDHPASCRQTKPAYQVVEQFWAARVQTFLERCLELFLHLGIGVVVRDEVEPALLIHARHAVAACTSRRVEAKLDVYLIGAVSQGGTVSVLGRRSRGLWRRRPQRGAGRRVAP